MNAWIHVNEIPPYGDDSSPAASRFGANRPRSAQFFIIGNSEIIPGDEIIEDHDGLVEVRRRAPDYEYLPIWDESRDRPYKQGTEWAEAANAAMSACAQARRQHRG